MPRKKSTPKTAEQIAATFRQNLAAAREAAGLSQKRIEEISGVHQVHVSRIETGDREPGLETIIRLALALNVEVSELFREPKPNRRSSSAAG